jgi:ArsR family transcriptional regulator
MHNFFKAVDDPTRRQIIEMLKKQDLTAGEIADAFHISKPSISYHLDLLRQAGLVISVKKGQFVYYSLNTTVLDEVITWLMGIKETRKK